MCPVIIDTDCAIDDLRAIVMLAACRNINIKAVVTSDGTLPPKEGAGKVAALLYTFGRKDIPIGVGRKFNQNPPFWRNFSSTIYWGDEPKIDTSRFFGATDLLREIISATQKKITLVCLGPLTNIADLLKQCAECSSKIHRILWYVESVIPEMKGSNYDTDPESAKQVMDSGIRLFCISALGKPSVTIDNDYISIVSSLDTIYAKAILDSFLSPGMKEKIETKHLKLWDDLVPLFIISPENFQVAVHPENPQIFYTFDFQADFLKAKVYSVLAGYAIYEDKQVSIIDYKE